MPYDDNNSGVLFAAREKKTEKSPDYTGKLKIDGVEYKLSGWKRTSPKVKGNFLSLRIARGGGHNSGGQDVDF